MDSFRQSSTAPDQLVDTTPVPNPDGVRMVFELPDCLGDWEESASVEYRLRNFRTIGNFLAQTIEPRMMKQAAGSEPAGAIMEGGGEA